MKFQQFSKILNRIEATSSRNDMTDLLVDMLKNLSKGEVDEALYLMQGRVVPRFIPLEFNVARKLMIRALSQAFRVGTDEIQEQFNELGDLGLVAQKRIEKQASDITILDVYQQLKDMALVEGKDSQQIKLAKISDLIKICDHLSGRYVTRMILGNLRLGVSDKSILDALSILAVGNKSKREALDKAYGVRNDIALIAGEVISKGIAGLDKITVLPGVPVASMLCEREATLGKILERIPKPIVQPKYDGLRAQIHYDQKGLSIEDSSVGRQHHMLANKGSNVAIYSRNLEALTNMFPDVVADVAKLGVKSLVLDGEIIAYDESTDQFLPFQETIQRRRKHDIGKKLTQVPVRLYVYDILYLDGRDLLDEYFQDRNDILENIIKRRKGEGLVFLTPSVNVNKLKGIESTFYKYVEEGLEGIIVKNPKSLYLPAKRGYDWIKYKKSSKGYVVDTVDAVVLGYYKGRGSRSKFGIGALLIGILDKKRKTFQSIAKVGTGIKDEEWIKFRKRLDGISLGKKPTEVEVLKNLEPDVWVEPRVVVEVESDEITRSPNHMAGFDGEMGYSLRFPRLKLFDRIDKTPERITTVKEIEKWYKWSKERR
ncbi:MAG: ATP-dependent DNA ligase [Candidatus Dojkabacteria bacterium]|nr:ATP-dependent DNA ligase [Candidatus Dojkabacteria bacterium]